MEIWKETKQMGANYLISNFGNVKSISRYKNNNGGLVFHNEMMIKKQVTKKGYNSVSMTINKKFSTFPVHRLVATAFIPNPENKPQVNHIDGNKLNNDVSNLEWCTNRENITHKNIRNKKKTSKYVGVHFSKKYNKWVSQINIEGKTYNLISSNYELDCKKKYDEALNNWLVKKEKPKK